MHISPHVENAIVFLNVFVKIQSYALIGGYMADTLFTIKPPSEDSLCNIMTSVYL